MLLLLKRVTDLVKCYGICNCTHTKCLHFALGIVDV